MAYEPKPVDTSRVKLTAEIRRLSELLARNAHEVWASKRLAEGWSLGPVRLDARKEHPCLVAYEDLPESEKDYDRALVLETIKTLLALDYSVVPAEKARGAVPGTVNAGSSSGAGALPEGGASGSAGRPTARSLTRALDELPSELVALLGFWLARDPEAWSEEPEIYARLAQKVLKLGEPLVAYDVVREGLECAPGDARLRQQMALALARGGASAAASEVLRGLYEQGHRDEETLGLLGRAHKDLAAQAEDRAAERHNLRLAQDFYEQAYAGSRGYWSGINAATLALVLGDAERAATLAREVRESCLAEIQRARVSGAKPAERYWALATLGEAALILGETSAAEDWYGRAVEAAPGGWADIASTRRNARLLAGQRGEALERIDRLLRIPRVVVFSGHMIDRPDRAVARFPARIEGAVRAALRERLKGMDVGFGYASAACGSDLLFLEAILEQKAEAHVVLPYEKAQFMTDSVAIVPGADWPARFERVLGQAAEVIQASGQRLAEGSVSFEYANLMLTGLATIRAQQLETELIPLTVWNEGAGDGAGGTASLVARWCRLGLAVEVIKTDELLRSQSGCVPALAGDPAQVGKDEALRPRAVPGSQSGSAPALAGDSAQVGKDEALRPRAVPGSQARAASLPDAAGSGGLPAPDERAGAGGEFTREIRGILFADAVGFSKLTEPEVPLFVRHFLGLVGDLVYGSSQSPLTMNTWGDGLYLVFSTVRETGLFALDLAEGVGRTDWAERGLPANLNLRVGLHAGPVTACIDPVTKHRTYIGAHVSRTARIEPITPPGQVYASQAFASLACAEGVRDFRCDYVGRTAMAKKFGVFPTFVVRRCRAPSPPAPPSPGGDFDPPRS